MKKITIISVLLLLLLSLSVLFSCQKGNDNGAIDAVYFTVSFNSNGGSNVPKIQVAKGETASEPSVPQRDGYIFDYWADSDGKKWNFNTNEVTSDLTLTAKWIDAASVFGYVPVKNGISITECKKSDLKIIRIPDVMNGYSVVGISDEAFKDVSSEQTSEIVIPSTVTSVGTASFSGCSGVKISIEGTITSIGENAFKNCDTLTQISLGDGLVSVPYAAFSGCSAITFMSIPKSVTTVCENAFESCSSLKSVIMHDTTVTVEDSAFRACESLVAIYYCGTAEGFSAMSIASGNERLSGAALYLYSEIKPEEDAENNYWYFNEKGKIKLWE